MARRSRPPRPHLAVRHPHRRLARLRGHRIQAIALLAVVGPGLLAGLSDDDPAGITTYSILGADFGYRLLWVLALSTAALIVFHELAARTGVVTGKGLMRLVRERYGSRATTVALSALVVANVGTICAEFAGVAAGMEVLTGTSKYLTVPFAALAVSVLVLRGSFGRVEHVLLALSAIFVAYIFSGVLAHPDWGATARGLVVPSLPGTRHGILVVVATLGTTLAPWGLAFIQSYAVDKRLQVKDLGYERIDVAGGALLTGIIGAFIVVACAATLHASGRHIVDAQDAAVALKPLAGSAAQTLFGLGLVGAALLAAAVVPLSTAYSVAEAFEQPADLNDSFAKARLFYGSYGVSVLVAVTLVLIPGAPLIQILFLSQALNAVLLLAILPFLRALARDRELMGEHRLSRVDSVLTAGVITLVAVSVVALLTLSIF
ncbi:MAG TPA: Nramp family divalent metal transporter [Conexibacter sp.]|jgi:Mn2+/Fe2+ NRAMP family transporter|nr:Nramp family divalent metal transporter [Conexibacter sp.]